MCGRYVSPEEADIERTWNKVRIRNPLGLDPTRFSPNWNVAPTHQVPALRRADLESDASGAGGDNGRGTELVALRWGLIPSWAKGVPPKFGTIMLTYVSCWCLAAIRQRGELNCKLMEQARLNWCILGGLPKLLR